MWGRQPGRARPLAPGTRPGRPPWPGRPPGRGDAPAAGESTGVGRRGSTGVGRGIGRGRGGRVRGLRPVEDVAGAHAGLVVLRRHQRVARDEDLREPDLVVVLRDGVRADLVFQLGGERLHLHVAPMDALADLLVHGIQEPRIRGLRGDVGDDADEEAEWRVDDLRDAVLVQRVKRLGPGRIDGTQVVEGAEADVAVLGSRGRRVLVDEVSDGGARLQGSQRLVRLGARGCSVLRGGLAGGGAEGLDHESRDTARLREGAIGRQGGCQLLLGQRDALLLGQLLLEMQVDQGLHGPGRAGVAGVGRCRQAGVGEVLVDLTGQQRGARGGLRAVGAEGIQALPVLPLATADLGAVHVRQRLQVRFPESVGKTDEHDDRHGHDDGHEGDGDVAGEAGIRVAGATAGSG